MTEFGKWEPIETAPKDRWVILTDGAFVSFGRWNDDKYNRKPRPYWELECHHGRARRARENQPTMWMPAPLPEASSHE